MVDLLMARHLLYLYPCTNEYSRCCKYHIYCMHRHSTFGIFLSLPETTNIWRNENWVILRVEYQFHRNSNSPKTYFTEMHIYFDPLKLIPKNKCTFPEKRLGLVRLVKVLSSISKNMLLGNRFWGIRKRFWENRNFSGLWPSNPLNCIAIGLNLNIQERLKVRWSHFESLCLSTWKLNWAKKIQSYYGNFANLSWPPFFATSNEIAAKKLRWLETFCRHSKTRN